MRRTLRLTLPQRRANAARIQCIDSVPSRHQKTTAGAQSFRRGHTADAGTPRCGFWGLLAKVAKSDVPAPIAVEFDEGGATLADVAGKDVLPVTRKGP